MAAVHGRQSPFDLPGFHADYLVAGSPQAVSEILSQRASFQPNGGDLESDWELSRLWLARLLMLLAGSGDHRCSKTPLIFSYFQAGSGTHTAGLSKFDSDPKENATANRRSCMEQPICGHCVTEPPWIDPVL